MNNVGQKYLPIGTVVMLKGGSKRVMITGFCSMATEDQSTMFDYAGCMYPEGFLSSDQTALFNHNQIERVYHLGLLDEEEQKFKMNLNALVAQMNTSTQNAVTNVTVPVEHQTQVNSVQSVEQPVPPVGPGLPGYAAPQIPAATSVVQQPVQTQQQNPQSQPQTLVNIQFDENGTGVSA